ncbi:hypothetical protein F9C07_9956 [Aspergillus flavus]|uniref:Transmembrane protein n=1 Tax=Aspergillus flavus (strain ATCC 200026 / FGSC A1120 / IAM 13836 / NRRL 3357 / JCM 12722 / SRRC 167) TaxID=332952 RepID=A0A7U2QR62_ASPFN|nr:hypothetical protein F9C07_9956 [Aspergillus flavus]
MFRSNTTTYTRSFIGVYICFPSFVHAFGYENSVSHYNKGKIAGLQMVHRHPKLSDALFIGPILNSVFAVAVISCAMNVRPRPWKRHKPSPMKH